MQHAGPARGTTPPKVDRRGLASGDGALALPAACGPRRTAAPLPLLARLHELRSVIHELAEPSCFRRVERKSPGESARPRRHPPAHPLERLLGRRITGWWTCWLRAAAAPSGSARSSCPTSSGAARRGALRSSPGQRRTRGGPSVRTGTGRRAGPFRLWRRRCRRTAAAGSRGRCRRTFPFSTRPPRALAGRSRCAPSASRRADRRPST